MTLTLCILETPKLVLYSEDQDETPHSAVFHQWSTLFNKVKAIFRQKYIFN